MFVFNEKTGKLLNLDMVSEVLVGREKNKLTIARENGAMGIFADYSTETEAREALWKLMEYEDTELSPEEIERVNKFEDTPHTCDTCQKSPRQSWLKQSSGCLRHASVKQSRR